MFARRLLPAVMALALVACAPGASLAPGSGDKRSPAAKANGVTGATARSSPGGAAPATGATPSLAPATAGSQAPARGPGLLLAGTGTRPLKGTIRVEASYFVKAAGGRIIGENGAGIIGENGAGIIGENGAGIIGENGAGIIGENGAGAVAVGSGASIARAGSNIIANNGSALLANNGAGLISDKAGALISDKAGALISDKAGALISDKGVGYRLAATGAPAVGELRPAAGMLVGVVDLRTGGLVAIGKDADGRPAYGVFTDVGGGYVLHVPEALRGNVAVLAVPPVETRDRRLIYPLITPVAAATPAAIDEESATVSRFMRRALLARFTAIMRADDVEKAIDAALPSETFNKALVDAMRPLLRELNGAGRAARLHEAPQADAEAVAQRALDAILARVDLDGMVVDQSVNQHWNRPPTRAIALFVEILRGAREKSAAALARDPAFFEKQPWLIAANQGKPTEARYAIEKASDLGEFVMNEYLTRPGSSYKEIQAVFDAIGHGEKVVHDSATGAVGNRAVDDITSGMIAVLFGMISTLASDADGAKTAVLDMIRDSGKR